MTDDLLMFWRLPEECAALSVTLGVVHRPSQHQMHPMHPMHPTAGAAGGVRVCGKEPPAAGRELNFVGVWALIMLMGERHHADGREAAFRDSPLVRVN